MIFIMWAFLLASVGAVTLIGKKIKVLPIVSQLIFAFIFLPFLYFCVFPNIGMTGKILVSDPFVKIFYTINFSILFGYILSDVIDLKFEKKSIKIALPSFFIPFLAGILLALFILKETAPLQIVAIGLLSSITAIPVLYLYLKNFNYEDSQLKKLVQAAILMDILCWSIFALVKNDTHIVMTIIVVVAGLIPFALSKVLKIKNNLAYSVPFFIGMVVLDYFKLNILMFGIFYMISLAICKVPFKLPFPEKGFNQYMVFVAIPFIIVYGVVQIDYNGLKNDSIIIFLSLLLIPILSKVLGSWIGLYWADKSQGIQIRWFEAVMLNTRGLTEIVFLNMLFQQGVISQQIYFSMMLMGLLSTVISGVYGNKKYPV